jgi:hypothetical protein
MGVIDLPRVRALRLCPWCADLKRIGAIACEACTDDFPAGDLMVMAGALERRLVHADLLSLADRTARAARRATYRAREASAALWRGFASDEAGSGTMDFALVATFAASWAFVFLMTVPTFYQSLYAALARLLP